MCEGNEDPLLFVPESVVLSTTKPSAFKEGPPVLAAATSGPRITTLAAYGSQSSRNAHPLSHYSAHSAFPYIWAGLKLAFD